LSNVAILVALSAMSPVLVCLSDSINYTRVKNKMRKNNNFIPLTTQVPPKTFVAIQRIARNNGLSESAYVRRLLVNTSEIAAEIVCDDEVVNLSHSKRRRPKKKPSKSWIKKLLGR
jgi:hypothetical protein